MSYNSYHVFLEPDQNILTSWSRNWFYGSVSGSRHWHRTSVSGSRNSCPETDVMDQFLNTDTDIMGEKSQKLLKIGALTGL